MKYLNNLYILLLTAIVMSAANCGSKRKIPQAVTKQDSVVTQIIVKTNTNNDSINIANEAFNKINANKINYATFSAKARLDYIAPDQNFPEVNAFIRIKHDSIIWINIEKFGITMGRILITKDSILILDKYNKNYTARSFDYLQDVAQISFDFATIENLIVGNPVYFNKPISNIKKYEKTTTVLCINDLFKHLITVSNDNYTIQHSKLDDVNANRNRTCDLSYDEYELKDGKLFAKDRNIVISEKVKIEIKLNFKQYQFNETLNYPFAIPSNYKRK